MKDFKTANFNNTKNNLRKQNTFRQQDFHWKVGQREAGKGTETTWSK